jgi:hypothetical protein
MDIKKTLKRIYVFLWEEDSPQSYIAFIIISYLLLKFVVYPGFLFVMGWQDVVSVLSSSMTHSGDINATYYAWLDSRDINYTGFPFPDGLEPGDAVVVRRVSPGQINVGDVIVYVPYKYTNESIIHRVVSKDVFGGKYYFTTKGDANSGIGIFEINITDENIIGKAILSVPFLGYPRAILHNFLGI